MCRICEGYTDEERMRELELTIIRYGCGIRGVTAEPEHDPVGGWFYTVGATESFGIPEFVITDLPSAYAGHILNWAVRRMSEGWTLDDIENDQVLWQAVHPHHLSGDMFDEYREYYGRFPEEGWMLQLFPSTDEECASCVAKSSTDLGDPTSRPEWDER